MAHPEQVDDFLLDRAREGDVEALGSLLERYRNYLRVVARSLTGKAVQGRLASSDVVQETYLEAYREFAKFRGGGEAELLSWLRKILVHNIAQLVAFHHAGKRDLRRDRSIDRHLDHASEELHAALASPIGTASEQVSGREQAVLLADAIERLPDSDRLLVQWRNLERLPFDQIATRTGHTPGALRKQWARAVQKLARMLEEPP